MKATRQTGQGASPARRRRSLRSLERWAEPTLMALGVLWLVLLVVEFVEGAQPWVQRATLAIWIVFCADFLVRLWIAPVKLAFLRRNWVTLISLALPAVRVLRVARALRLFRATRGLRLVRLLTSFNRGFRSLASAMNRKGAGYVAALTVLVTGLGAAGMLAFEGAAFSGFGEALWWTAMLVTTVGSEYWPVTVEGRILALLLSIYAVGVFGYLAASLASVLIGREEAERAELKELHRQIAALTAEVRRARAHEDGERS